MTTAQPNHRESKFTMVRFIAPLSLGFLFRAAWSLPMQVTVNQRQSECLYDRLEEGEKVTLSAFILSGPSLRATVMLEGPLAPSTIDSGIELHAAAEAFADKTKSEKEKYITYSKELDFEHLNTPMDDDDDDDDDDDGTKDDEPPIDPNDPDAAQKRRERRERQRQAFLEAKAKRDEKRAVQQKKIRQDGEPFLYTAKAPAAGWYRVCVQGTWYQVIAEMEMRKESELGGVDEDGHVLTYEENVMNQEDKDLEKDTASAEGITDQDFQETRDKVKDLRRLLNEIQSMQQKERRRLTVHAETNEHSHSRMVLSSLLETLFFMAVTGYQVYTIRKWFSGAPVLGR